MHTQAVALDVQAREGTTHRALRRARTNLRTVTTVTMPVLHDRAEAYSVALGVLPVPARHIHTIVMDTEQGSGNILNGGGNALRNRI